MSPKCRMDTDARIQILRPSASDGTIAYLRPQQIHTRPRRQINQGKGAHFSLWRLLQFSPSASPHRTRTYVSGFGERICPPLDNHRHQLLQPPPRRGHPLTPPSAGNPGCVYCTQESRWSLNVSPRTDVHAPDPDRNDGHACMMRCATISMYKK